MAHTPTTNRPHHAGMGGTQKLYRFPNGYGASVIAFPGSYGYELGKKELAVLELIGPDVDDFTLTYDTPITGDVLGYLSDDDVEDTLTKIAALPPTERKQDDD